MNIRSNFNKSSTQDWEDKVIEDFKDKVIDDFYWKTSYGNINPFSINKELIDNFSSQSFNEIRWRFNNDNKINSNILNRLKDGVNSINIDGINFKNSIFDNVMCSIIQTHIKLSPNTNSSEIKLWNNWGDQEIKGSIRMDPLENILENFSESNLNNQFKSYQNFSNIIKNKNLKCIYVNGEVYLKYFNDFSTEIAFLVSHFNEIIEYHISNQLDIPKKVMIQTLIGNSFLESISKIKAIRFIINQIIKTHNLKMEVYIETSPNPEILKQKELDFRIMTLTSTALSSLLGGANTFEMSNSLLESNEDYWKKIMINVPLILTEESNINNEMSKGAHIIEQISIKMAQSSWSIFKEIENRNGLISVIKNKEHTNYYKFK
tara:strand:- start:99 stop:1226 length:1128 start_codon:yes stop_codon:yes gene_type:complete